MVPGSADVVSIPVGRDGEEHMSEADRAAHIAAESAARGDREALRTVTASVWPMIVRYCRARVGEQAGTWAIADDIARRACVSVVGQYEPERHGTSPFSVHVYRVTARTVALSTRPKGKGLHPGDRMSDIIGDLEPMAREVMILRLIAGMSVVDTAAALGMPAGRVRVVQHRALRECARSGLT